MAFHTGVISGPTDCALRDALAQFNTDANSARRCEFSPTLSPKISQVSPEFLADDVRSSILDRWENLPYAFAATLGSDFWRRAKYKARTGAFESNLHCLTYTIFQVTATMDWVASDNASERALVTGPPVST